MNILNSRWHAVIRTLIIEASDPERPLRLFTEIPNLPRPYFGGPLLADDIDLSAERDNVRNISTGHIKAVQSILNDGGYYKKGIDGIYGPYTEQAAKDFQTQSGFLLDDGVVGPLTKTAMLAKRYPAANIERRSTSDGSAAAKPASPLDITWPQEHPLPGPMATPDNHTHERVMNAKEIIWSLYHKHDRSVTYNVGPMPASLLRYRLQTEVEIALAFEEWSLAMRNNMVFVMVDDHQIADIHVCIFLLVKYILYIVRIVCVFRFHGQIIQLRIY